MTKTNIFLTIGLKCKHVIALCKEEIFFETVTFLYVCTRHVLVTIDIP